MDTRPKNLPFDWPWRKWLRRTWESWRGSMPKELEEDTWRADAWWHRRRSSPGCSPRGCARQCTWVANDQKSISLDFMLTQLLCASHLFSITWEINRIIVCKVNILVFTSVWTKLPRKKSSYYYNQSKNSFS